EMARQAYGMQPGFNTAVAVAVAQQSRGDVEAALAAYRDALTFEPKDVSARLSMADLLWDRGRLEEAEALYAEAEEIEPTQPWAVPSRLYLAWAQRGDEEARFKLLALTDASPDNDRAARLADLATPYLGFLPEPTDATTNLLKERSDAGGP